MGNLYRSEDMHLLQLFIQAEAVHDTMEELGKLALIEFEDLNADVSNFNRTFVNEVKRCDEMLRKLRFFREQVERERIPIPDEGHEALVGSSESSATARMDVLEQRFTELETELLRINANADVLDKSHQQLTELWHLYKNVDIFFADAQNDFGGEEMGDATLLGPGHQPSEITNATPKGSIKLAFTAGVIAREKWGAFERILWRATRNNLYLRHTELGVLMPDPQQPMGVLKNVFVIFHQGERLAQIIGKICEAMGATMYPCPENRLDRERRVLEIELKSRELDTVIYRTSEQRRLVLERMASQINPWNKLVMNEKAVFMNMNKCNYHVSRKALIAEGWAPLWADPEIQAALDRGRARSNTAIRSVFYPKATKKSPPTFFMTNKYTVAFQTIVDTYGMARYKEVNPGVYAIVTFPFLFGIMFGDIGHGMVLTIASAIAIWYEKNLEKKITGEIMGGIFGARYLLFAMGLMSMYAGFMYNDIFALSISIADSNFARIGKSQYFAWNALGTGYPFGVDPNWAGATNKMAFMNSLKMKLSIIMGVSQMGFGVILSLFNHRYFKRPIDVWSGAVPQIILLAAMFGYLSALIILKWCTNWNGLPSPPMLLTTLINMFLKFGDTIPPSDQLFAGQREFQMFLVFVILICVPWMLCPKPYLLNKWHKEEVARLEANGGVEEHHEEEEETGGHGGGHGGEGDEHEEFEFGEIVVHQIIHTIEYVLGTVSNTASYLRLWALSLAHAQLSEVIWDQIMLGRLVSGNPVIIFLGFGAWVAATTVILMCMECMGAFLHALRLHWVEFQSKYYVGDGRRFSPFDLSKTGQAAED